MISKEVFDEYARKRLKDLLERGEKPVVVAGFIDCFGDGVLASCSKCYVPVLVRPWLRKAIDEHGLKVICVCCIDFFTLKGEIVMDFAKIEEQVAEG